MSTTATPNRPEIDGWVARARVQITYRFTRMSRQKLGAIALALLAALITQSALARASEVQASLGQTAPVVVADVLVPAGSILSAADMSVEMWPVGLIPEGALTPIDLEAVLVANANLYRGEPVLSSRVNSANLGLATDELAVTISQPLAPPPIEVGFMVQLVGVTGSYENNLASAVVLTTGRIVGFTDDAVTVAVDGSAMPRVVEHSAVGTVELVITPRRG